VARRVLDALAEPFHVGEEEIVVSASIGISMYPTDDVDLDTLIRHTDMAMYRSKSLGRGTYSFFSDDLTAAVTARVSLEGSLRRAIERQEFVLHYQPKSDLRTGQVTGVEALLRWQRPGHGLIAPDRFVSVLEDTGLILPVGAWVIRAACEQLAAWDRLGLPPLRLAVNLSARQFRHLYLASMVEDSLRENALDGQRLEIELTESLLMEDNDSTRSMLASFRRLGVRLAIDDFGTGHSSLSYIRRFQIDTLKIDRSFVQSLPDNGEDAAICSAVIALGRSMKMCVVAEGVETPEQAQVLRELGCDEMQGYWLGRPMPGSDFASWFVAHQRTRGRRRSSRSRFSDTSPITLFTLLDGAGAS
jgi:EAL domain-containing protein (putative c-di-GMP-specific phosphodiesterase class I)